MDGGRSSTLLERALEIRKALDGRQAGGRLRALKITGYWRAFTVIGRIRIGARISQDHLPHAQGLLAGSEIELMPPCIVFECSGLGFNASSCSGTIALDPCFGHKR